MTAPAPVLISLPHMPRYPLLVAGTWRATCKCHFWTPFAVEPTFDYTERGKR